MGPFAWAATQWHCLPPKPTSHKPVGWVFFMWCNQLVGFFPVPQPVGWVNKVEPGKPVNLKNRFSALRYQQRGTFKLMLFPGCFLAFCVAKADSAAA